MPTQMEPEVGSPEHRAQLEAIAAELNSRTLSPERRAELLALCEEIAAHYTCDERLCE